MSAQRRPHSCAVALALLLGAIPLAAAEPALHHDPLTDEEQARLEARDALLASILPPPPELRFFADKTKTWNPGSVVRVAFRGGDSTLHRRIAEVAQEWTRYATLHLDFKDGDGYRAWSPSDRVYQAEIRISFAGEGQRSAVGMDATDPRIFPPGVASMTLGGFATALPERWEATTLHEFGHALGFHHEHQRPRGVVCAKSIRWEDDPGYDPDSAESRNGMDQMGRRPGVYRVLGGPPWNWLKKKVDFNLREKPDSNAYILGARFDPFSIMKYWFPPWMYRDGDRSPCYTPGPNVLLSEEDKKGAASLYPEGTARILELLGERSRYYRLLLRSPELPEDLLSAYGARFVEIDKEMARLRLAAGPS